MSIFSQKQFQELNELYRAIYNNEEVEEETQEELEEGILDAINNYKRPAAKGPGQELGAINRAASNLMKSGGIGGAISRGVQSAQSGARKALGLKTPPKVNPGEKYGPGDGAASASRGTIGGLIKKDSTGSQGSSTQQPAAKPAAKSATAGKYSSQFKKSAPALSKTLTKKEPKKEPMMKSDLGGRLGDALSGKVSDFQFKDSYDMVLDYLLSGGHVESVEEAHYVMLEMDQETIQGICESYEMDRGTKADMMYRKANLKKEEYVDEADSLAAMQARREKRLARQRKQMGTSSTGQDFGHDYGISSAERKKRQQAEFDKFVGKKTKKEEVEAVDEALTGDRIKKAIKKPGGMAYTRKVSEDPSKRATRGGRGGESDFGAGDRGTGNRSRRRRGMSVDDED